MRHLVLAPFLVLVACSSGGDPNLGGVAPPVPASSILARSDVERDLAIETTRAAGAIDHERDPRIDVWLVNKSKARSYPVVLANDGSEVGWREPHAFFTVELLRASGTWEPPPVEHLGRCGVYARDWAQDLVDLAPGARVKMPWMPYYGGDLGDATKVRIVAHYEYGAQARDKSKIPPELHSMPEYALASAPIEIPVEHPYTLELKIKGALPAVDAAPLASALDVVVENRSKTTLPLGTSETGSQLWFEAIADGEQHVLYTHTEPTFASKDTIAAGARRSIVDRETRTESSWTYSRGRIQKMRAVWRIWDEDGGQNPNVRRVTSPWIDLR